MADKEARSGGYTSKLSTYKRYVSNTEVSYGSHTAQSSYTREHSTEYSSAKGTTSSSKEIVSGSESRSLPVYIAVRDFVPDGSNKDELPLDEGQIVEVLDNKNAHSWLVRTKARPPQTGWVPATYFETPAEYYRSRRRTREIEQGSLKMTKEEEAIFKRDQVFVELMRSEEQFVSELRYVLDNYAAALDDPSTPYDLRYLRDQLFLNFRDLYNFHANVLLKGLQYYSDDPSKVGQTFVRLERDFDHHVRFFKDLPDAEKLLEDEKVKNFFQSIKEKHDLSEKPLEEYLKLPMQRIQQYQSYMKELIKYTIRADKDATGLQKALELMLSIPQRANDLNFIRNIQEYPGDIVKAGRLLRHERFKVWENDRSGEAKERYVFLFKSKILITDRTVPEDPDDLPEFKHVATVRLDKYNLEHDRIDQDVIILKPAEGQQQPTFILRAPDLETSDFTKQAWAKDIEETKEGLGDDGPPRKKTKSPPAITPSGSSTSLYSSSFDLTGTGTSGTLEMQGTSVTRTQYGFRTLQESSAKMCLKVTGYPLPVITWFKDGEQLNEDDRHSFYADDDGFFALTIDPVKVEDTGRYSCVATNEYGQATTSAFFRVVKVEKPPESPKFLTELASKEVEEGASATFECEVEGWPEPELVWLIDGDVVHPSQDFKIDYDGQKAILEIRDAQPEDSGVYTVRIQNEFGAKESSAQLQVKEDPEKNKVPPEFQKGLENQEVDEGGTIKVKAVVAGDPIPDVHWLINGMPITPAENVQILAEDGIYLLTIKNISLHFDGQLTCTAVNRIGEASSHCQLKVNPRLAPPTVEEGLNDQMVHAGDRALFKLKVKAAPPPTVSWYLNETPLVSSNTLEITSTEEGEHTLTFLKVDAKQAGKVTAHIANEAGEVEADGNLGIKKFGRNKPEFQTKLGPIEVLEGDTLRAKLLVSGDPPPKVNWYINNKIVVETEDTQIIAEDGVYIMSIAGASPDMTGELKCVAYNKMGEITCSAPLTVTTRVPVEFEQFLADTECHEGDTLRLKAVLVGEPAPDVSWYISGRKLEESSNVKISQAANTYLVVISNITMDYSGEVLCKAVNEYGEATSSAQLVVHKRGTPPDFTEWLSNINAQVGDSIETKVVFTGAPTPNITWTINGVDITPSMREYEIITRKNVSTLKIKKFAANMVGEIICKAENDAGEVSCTAQMAIGSKEEYEMSEHDEEALAVDYDEEDDATDTAVSIADEEISLGKEDLSTTQVSTASSVRFVKKIRDVKVKKGQKALFECVVPDTKGIVVKWLKDGKEIELVARIRVSSRTDETGYRMHQLVIDKVTTEDSGSIECMITNMKQTQKCVAKLELEEFAPEFLTPLESCTVTETGELKLECVVTGHPQPVVKWFKDNTPIAAGRKVSIESTEEGVQRLVISDVKSTDAGTYKVECTSDMGVARSECQVSVEAMKPGQPKIVSQLRAQTVDEKEDVTFECKIEPLRQAPEVKWYRDEQEVLKTSHVSIESDSKTGLLSLKIKGAEERDIGQYKVEVKNASGRVVSEAPLQVHFAEPVEETVPAGSAAPMAPDFNRPLKAQEVTESQSAVLECAVTGEPRPQVTWFKDGKSIQSDASHVIEALEDGTQRLVLKESVLKDAGRYQCVASNDIGKSKTEAELIVYRASEEVLKTDKAEEGLQFVSGLQATETVTEGSSLTLECVIVGKPKPEVNWYHGREKIASDADFKVESLADGTERLTIKSAKSGLDDGQYTCKAVSSVGVAETRTELTVEVADEVELETSEIAELTSEAAPVFTKALRTVQVDEGKVAILECTVAGAPAPDVQWFKDGKKIRPDAKHKVESLPDGTQRLIISNAAESDIGDYRCEAVSAMGSAESHSLLEVKIASKRQQAQAEETAPEFKTALETKTAEEGGQVVLEVAVSGQPAPEVHWYKDDKEIKPDRGHIIEEFADGRSRLTIQKASSKDVGSYKCEAVNAIGTAETHGDLDVRSAKDAELSMGEEEAPRFTTQLSPATAVESDHRLVLEVAVSGTPAPEIHWYKDDEEIKPDKGHIIEKLDDGRQRLVIEHATVEDVGSYRCEATNVSGKAKTQTQLKVQTAQEQDVSMSESEELPEFTSGLKSIKAVEGETAVLECASTGTAAQVRWYKGSDQIVADKTHVIESQADGTQRLTIKQISTVDSSEYTCEVVTPAGTAVTEGTLEVKKATQKQVAPQEEVLEFTTSLTTQKAKEGDKVTLECAVSGKPVEVHWYKDGKEIKPDKGHLIESRDNGTLQLIIQKATSEDTSTYTCEVVGPMGKAKTEGTLEVKVAEQKATEKHEEAPEFVSDLQAQTAKQGEQVTLQCAVAGAGVEVKWFKGSQAITIDERHVIESLPDGTQRLIISEASTVDTSQYRCEAVNISGQATSKTTVKIQEAKVSAVPDEDSAPEFVQVLHSSKAVEGQDAVLTCKVEGKPAPEVKWFKGEQEIPANDKHLVIESKPDGTQSLIIKKAQKVDSGEYRCEATNERGTAWSEAPLMIKVADTSTGPDEETAPDFTEPLQACLAQEGEVARFEAKLIGTPTPEVTWYKNGEPIQASDHVVIESFPDGRQVLVVKSTGMADVGEYRCEAENAAGTTWSDATLQIQAAQEVEIESATDYAPEFERELHAYHADEGHTVEFECKVHAQPKPQVKWFKDGKEVKPSSHVEMIEERDGTYKLIVHEATHEDQGNYKVEFVNPLGSMSSKAPLTVHEAFETEEKSISELAVEFVEGLKESYAEEGQQLTLECAVAKQVSPAQIKWFKDGVEVLKSPHVEIVCSADGHQKLVISEAAIDDIGKYQCVVVTDQGEAETHAAVKVAPKAQEPEFAKTLSNSQVKVSDNISLVCKLNVASAKDLSKVKWLKDDVEVTPSSHLKVETQPDGTCSLTVNYATMNDAGQYTCVATNADGTTATTAELNVEEVTMYAPEFSRRPEDATVNLERPLVLEAKISGQPFPEVQWYKDGQEVKDTDNISLTADADTGIAKLQIKRASSVDGGTYRCMLKNDAGQASCKAVIKVEAKKLKVEETIPAFTAEPKDVDVAEGEPIRLVCKVSGEPLPEVTWLKNGSPLKESASIKIRQDLDGECSLVIANSSPEDAGKFTIALKNKAGSIEKTIKVNVEAAEEPMEVSEAAEPEEAPTFKRKLQDKSGKEGDKITLEVEVEGKPKSVKWYKGKNEVKPDGKRIKVVDLGGNKYQLVIGNAEKGDADTYKVVASNDGGDVSSSATIKVVSADEPVAEEADAALTIRKGLSDANVSEGETLDMAVEVGGTPRAVKWYKNGTEVKPDNKRVIVTTEDGKVSLVIKDAKTSDSGKYKVDMSNDTNSVYSEATIKVAPKVEEPAPEEADAALTIRKGLADVTAVEDETLELAVEVGGKPKTVKWYKNGTEVKPDNKRVKVITTEDGKVSLIVKNSTESDSGKYRVELSNNTNTVSSDATITVEPSEEPAGEEADAALTIKKGLAGVNASEGETLELEVEVEGTARQVKWYKNGSEVKPDNKRVKVVTTDDGKVSLIIKDAKKSDSGKYKVELSNDTNSVTSDATINVLTKAEEPKGEEADAALTIRKGLSDVNAKEGETFELAAEVKGKPRQVKWYQNGKEIRPDGKNIIAKTTDDGKASLVVKSAKQADNGTYKVEFTNDTNTVFAEATVNVAPVEEEEPAEEAFVSLTIRRPLKDVTAKEKQPAILSAELDGKPKEIKWYKNGKQIVPDQKRIRAAETKNGLISLTIQQTEIEDAGTYRLELIDNAGNSVTTDATLAVKPEEVKPEADEEARLTLRKGLKDQQGEEGYALELVAEVDGTIVDVVWLKNGKEVEADGDRIRSIITDNGEVKLAISKAVKVDSGSYDLKVSNKISSVSSSAMMRVRARIGAPPKEEADVALVIKKGLDDVSADEGSTIELSAEVEGKPREIKWYRNGVELTPDKKRIRAIDAGDGKYKLIITQATTDDAGTYKLKLSNKTGAVETEAAVSVEAAPAEEPMEVDEAPEEAAAPAEAEVSPLSIVKGLEDCIVPEGQKLELSAEFDRPPKTIKWYKNGKEIKPLAGKLDMPKSNGGKTCSLILKGAKNSDEGVYKIQASDDTGDVYSEATIQIPSKPVEEEPQEEPFVSLTIKQPLQDQEVDEGDKVHLAVEVDMPPKQVQWYKNGTEITPDGRKAVVESSLGGRVQRLVLQSAENDDAGRYKVVLSSDGGDVFSEATITVKPAEAGEKPVEAEAALTIRKGLKDQKCSEGDEVMLSAVIDGEPKEVKWYKNGRLLKPDGKRLKAELLDGGKYCFIISDAQIEDSASYKIEAANSVSVVASEAKLQVEESRTGPVIVKPLTDQKVQDGKQVIFEVELKSKPTNLKWFKNNEELKASERIKLEKIDDTTYQLIITSAEKEDAGRIRVDVSDDVGSASSEAKLTVQGDAPCFKKGLSDKKVPVGSKLALEIEVEGRPKTVKWYKNGKEIKPDGKRVKLNVNPDKITWQLIFTEAEAEDAGTYKVEAINDYGAADTSGELTVEEAPKEKKEPPRFVKGLEDVSVPDGDKVTLEVEVEGKPKEVKWYRNGRQLKANKRIKIEVVDDRTYRLIFEKASKEEDEGTIKVEATNAHGTAASEGKLAVTGEPPYFITGITDRTVQAKGKLAIEVEVEGRPHMTWFKDGVEIEKTPRISFEECNHRICRLVVQDIKMEDHGVYKVVAVNAFGEADSQGTITVEDVAPKGERPKFVRGLSDKEADESTKAIMEVEISGKPKEVKWYKNGRLIKPSRKWKLEQLDDATYRLVIPEVSKDDEGQYKVEAVNDYGTADTEASFTVHEKTPAVEAEPEEAFAAARILLPLRDREIPEKEAITLSCKVTGEPFPEVAWLKDDVEVQPNDQISLKVDADGTCRLIIKEARLEDAGTYTCSVHNEHGSDKTACKLKVEPAAKPDTGRGEYTGAPVFTKPLRDRTAAEKDDIVLEVKVMGDPMPDIKWFLDDKEIQFSNRIGAKTESVGDELTCRLTIRDATKADAGLYKCVATNKNGSAKTNGMLTVAPSKPDEECGAKFVIPLRSQAVTEGKDISFDIKVRGKPTPQLQWFKDNRPIDTVSGVVIEDMGDNRYRLTIKNAEKDHDGVYKCVAENKLGSDTCEAELTVNPPKERRKPEEEQYAPYFPVQLHDRRVPKGHNMTIECFVSAKPGAHIKWSRDGVDLSPSNRLEILTLPDGKCRLSVNDFSPEDEGSYRCLASNALGTATTRCNLKVEALEEKEQIVKREFAPRFTEDLYDKTVKDPTPVSLSCRVHGIPTPDIKWYKDGIPLQAPTDNVSWSFNPEDGLCTINIAKATIADTGAYRCVATNTHGSSNTVCMLTVEGKIPERKREGEAPFFLKGLSDVLIEQKSDFTLRTIVAGSPTPNVKWYKDGMMIRLNDRVRAESTPDGTHTLTIANAAMTDEGLYRCVAENAHGFTNTLGTVQVEGLREKREFKEDLGEAPRFVVPLQDITLSEGGTLELDCKVAGKPHPQIKWFKDGAALRGNNRVLMNPVAEGRYRLTVMDAHSGDSGVYRCVATNEKGQATSKANVTIGSTQPPPIPKPATSVPRFVVPITTCRTAQGSPLRLECKAHGSPLPTFEWYKDGEKVKPDDPRVKTETLEDGTAILTIDEALPDDEGLYRCVALSPAGSANTKANVVVKPAWKPPDMGEPVAEYRRDRAPKFIQPLDNVKIKSEGTATFRARVSGVPFPEIKWMKDGERLYPYERFEMRNDPESGVVELSIHRATVSDNGTYRCVIENQFGQASSRSQLWVEAKEPRVAKSFEDQIKQGKAPGFIKPLTVCRVSENNTAVFECLPHGNPFPKIQWLKDGMELSSTDRLKIEALEDGRQRLTLSNAHSSDEGYYRCVISNEFGLTSTKAELIVEADISKQPFGTPDQRSTDAARDLVEDTEPRPPRFRQGIRNITVAAGSPATFECGIAGYPKPSIKWYRGSHEIIASDRHLMWVDEYGFARLLILNSQEDDEDDYRCEITNEHGTAHSDASLSLLRDRTGDDLQRKLDGATVIPPGHHGYVGPDVGPGFLKQLRNRYIMAGTPAIFDCIICGHPTPDVEWFHNGKPLVRTDRIKIMSCGGGSHAIVILRADPDDSGEYKIVARNSMGTASSTGVLEVSVPFAQVGSFKGYDLKKLSYEEYMHKKLQYSGIPTPPDRGPFIREVTGHYLTLSWIPTLRAPPRYPEVTYIVELRELPERNWYMIDYNVSQPVCKVRNLELGKSYQFRVRAENIYGISDPSPASPPSQLMAPPRPVLDKYRRPIPLLDPYAEQAMNKAYSEQYACAPWFAPVESDKAYCGVNGTLEIIFWVYGFPDPDVTWTFRGNAIDTSPGSKFKIEHLHGTECVLTIRGFTQEDAGQYQCCATNSHGEAEQKVYVELATLPSFLQPLENKVAGTGKSVRFDVRVDGNPFPQVKWFKDWHPLATSHRIKMTAEEPYRCSLIINDTILRDSGIYTCQSQNAAGKTTTTSTLTIESEPPDYELTLNDLRRTIMPKLGKRVSLKTAEVKELYKLDVQDDEDDVSEAFVPPASTGAPMANGPIMNGQPEPDLDPDPISESISEAVPELEAAPAPRT